MTCVEGKILDVIVDFDKKSKTYLKYKFINLDQNKMDSLFIGENYAHGFLTLTKKTTILAKISSLGCENIPLNESLMKCDK